MRILKTCVLLSAVALIIGCNATSDPTLASSPPTLQLLHSNDMTGYVEPCG